MKLISWCNNRLRRLRDRLETLIARIDHYIYEHTVRTPAELEHERWLNGIIMEAYADYIKNGLNVEQSEEVQLIRGINNDV